MPLPIGHALAGIAFFEARPGLFFTRRWHDALFFIFLANLPDADFLPGLLTGRPNLFHHGIFHSVGAALAVAALGGFFFSLKKRPFPASAAMIFLVLYAHLLLDFFSLDLAAPFGLPLFWPFSSRYFIAAHPIFLNITRAGNSRDFFPSLFNMHNLEVAAREILVLGGLLAVLVAARRLGNQKRPGK
jgi:membrane-bound metal-dependent hydrolase YbcI (DUF457 family)